MAEVIHIHEDDWGMRNLYPLAVRREAEADVADAAAAAEKNRDPSGFGYTDIYSEAAIPTACWCARATWLLPTAGRRNYSPVQYIPRQDFDMRLLRRSDHGSYCTT